MLMQAKQLERFWKLSKLDGMVWIVTVLSVVLIGIDIGLLAGLLTSLASILLLSIKPYACLLGHVPNTDLYLDMNRYKGASFFFFFLLSHNQYQLFLKLKIYYLSCYCCFFFL